jgi:3-deoxy-D-manno-octulosonic-acid transferase
MSALVYWLVIRLYAIGLRIASLFSPKAKLFIKGRKGLLSRIRYALIDERRPRIWIHCASLGEFEQGRPLLEKIRKQHPQHAIVLTFFSPSGFEVRKNYDGADHIFYLPLDSFLNAKRFLNAVQPKLALFIKYDLWYYLLMEAARRDIPMLLVSALFRKEQIFFKWYGWMHRRMLHCFAHIFAQSHASEQLLNKIGIENVTVVGDTRFDRVIEEANQKVEFPIAEAFCEGYKIIVAGSTWQEDELFLRALMQKLSADWRLILVPHEVNESHIQNIEKLFNNNTIRWSLWNEGSNKQILIVDKIGLLLQLYHYGRVAWIGGGFGKEGVHNVLEAAVYGIPVAFGPVFHQFLEAKELLGAHGALTTSDADLFAKQLSSWDKDSISYEQACSAARNYVMSKGGATAKIMDYIEAKYWLKT